MYFLNEGVGEISEEERLKEAVRWLKLAADQGHEAAIEGLEEVSEALKKLKAKMDRNSGSNADSWMDDALRPD